MTGRALVRWTDRAWADCRRSGREGPGANGEVPSGRTQSTRSAWRQSGRRGPDRRRGGTLRYGHDSVAGPVRISVRIQLDDDRVSEEQAALRLIEAGASRLGPTEDYEILHGLILPRVRRLNPRAAAGNRETQSFRVAESASRKPEGAVPARPPSSQMTLLRPGSLLPSQRPSPI
jgi:hypothetical protein